MSTPLKKSTPINKSLLTPCRRVGLSRIRKTPDSLAKLIKDTPGYSTGVPIDSPKTPATVKPKEFLKPPLDSPLAEVLPASPLEVKNDLPSKCKESLSGMGKAAKKSLVQKFAKECSVDVQKQTKDKPNKEDCSVAKEKTLKNAPETVTKQFTVDEEDEEPMKISRKRQRVLSDDSLPEKISERATDLPASKGVEKKKLSKDDSPAISDTGFETVTNHPTVDEDFIKNQKKNKRVLEHNLPKNPQEKTEKISKKETKRPTVKTAKKRKPQVLSDDDDFPEISTRKTATNPPSFDGDEDFIVIKKRSRRILSDDEGSNSQKSTDSDVGKRLKKTEKSLKKKISIQQSLGEDGDDDFVTIKPKKEILTSSQSLKREISKESIKNLSVKIRQLSEEDLTAHQAPEPVETIIIDDDEAAFTSTPKDEQIERADLLSNIGALELKVKEKRKTLEDLKRAATYKKMHSIDELTGLIEVWRKGCVDGLTALLEKLQAHSPLSMETLLNNLHIPSEIAKTKLKIL